MNLSPILKKLYPEGSVQGQCAVWAEKVVSFGPVGDSYQQKKAYVQANGIIATNITEIGRGYRIGDVIVSSEGTFMGMGNGHVCVIVDLVNGQPIVGESNFNKDRRVHYGRAIPIKYIYGIIRAPLKVDLGQCEFNLNVFINNQPSWKSFAFLEGLQNKILGLTDNKLKVNFFPLKTSYTNWWYEVHQFPVDGENYQVIAKTYLQSEVLPLVFTSENKPSDAFVFIVKSSEWQGAAFGQSTMAEIAWTDTSIKPAEIQCSCSEFDQSPWYSGMTLIDHILLHELSHVLHWINGLNDMTDYLDIKQHVLDVVLDDIDWNRIKANL